jgi:hypothetical protein
MTEMTEDITAALSQELFADEGLCVYAVLDGASVPELLPRLEELEPEYECLYRGELAPDMAEVAPYLVRLDANSEFAAWVLEQGWGKHWGVFATSEEDLRAVHRHLRKFLTVYDPQDERTNDGEEAGRRPPSTSETNDEGEKPCRQQRESRICTSARWSRASSRTSGAQSFRPDIRRPSSAFCPPRASPICASA